MLTSNKVINIKTRNSSKKHMIKFFKIDIQFLFFGALKSKDYEPPCMNEQSASLHAPSSSGGEACVRLVGWLGWFWRGRWTEETGSPERRALVFIPINSFQLPTKTYHNQHHPPPTTPLLPTPSFRPTTNLRTGNVLSKRETFS